MSTDLDTETAGAGDLIDLLYVYQGVLGSGIGLASLEAVAGALSLDDGTAALQQAIPQQSPFLQLRKIGSGVQASGAGASGYTCYVVQCRVQPDGDGLTFSQLLDPIRSVAFGPMGSVTLALFQGDYGDAGDNVGGLARQAAKLGPSLWDSLFRTSAATASELLQPSGSVDQGGFPDTTGNWEPYALAGIAAVLLLAFGSVRRR